MAEEKKYSFITVETDDDDDIVIQAGSPEPVSEVAEPGVLAEPEPAPVAFEPAEVVEALVEAPVSESAVASAQEDALKPVAAPVAPKRTKSDYRETTLEDLDSAPMGATQKIVIAAAVVAVLAFIAWYVLF